MVFQKKTIAVAVLGACAPLAAFAGPSVSWSAPSSGASMYGVYSNSSQCQVSGTGISRVKFYVDGQEVNSDNYAPYQCVFDTRKFKLGAHTLKATAFGTDGTTTTITRS